MTTMLLIRHGETDWNVVGRFQGHTDQPLNPTGEDQARALAEPLTSIDFAGVYSSDLLRVRRTAELALNGQVADLNVDARLRELSFGQWEGMTHKEIQTSDPEQYRLWSQDRENNPPGGERISDGVARVGSFLTYLRETYGQGERVLVFGHGGTLAIMICLLLGNDPTRWWQYRIKNCTLSEILLVENAAILQRFNDDAHLRSR